MVGCTEVMAKGRRGNGVPSQKRRCNGGGTPQRKRVPGEGARKTEKERKKIHRILKKTHWTTTRMKLLRKGTPQGDYKLGKTPFYW